MTKPSNVVQLNTRDARYERQIDKIFEELESLPIPFKERVAALYTLERIETMRFMKAKRRDHDGAGSSVRKYATAFTKKDGSGRGKTVARSVARDLDLEPDDDGDDAA